MYKGNIEHGLSFGEVADLHSAMHEPRKPPVRYPATRAGHDSIDGGFIKYAVNLHNLPLKAEGVHSLKPFSTVKELLDRLESEEAEDASRSCQYRTVTHAVRMAIFNGKAWTLTAGMRRINTPVEANPEPTDVMVMIPRVRIFSMAGVGPFYLNQAEEALRRPARKVYQQPQNGTGQRHLHLVSPPPAPIRTCNHPGCTQRFIPPATAPKADKCRRHHQELKSKQMERRAAFQLLQSARREQNKIVDAIRQVVRSGGNLPEGARVTATSGRQVTVACNGHSYTVHRDSPIGRVWDDRLIERALALTDPFQRSA